MNPETWTEEIVETSTRTKVLEERFERHLVQIENVLNKLDDKMSNLSQVIIGAEKSLTEKHYHTNDRIVKLESERGILAKALNAIIATMSGGLAGWLAKH